jgi:predicted nucleic acid-binding protein
MQVFLDTSVLVAASVLAHPHHSRALPLLRRLVDGQDEGTICAHSIAETYATLTRLPLQPRIQPTEAARILADNILPHVHTLALTPAMYANALTTMTDGGHTGAKIYDALLLACAASTTAERVYTFNLGDFLTLAPDALKGKVCAP